MHFVPSIVEHLAGAIAAPIGFASLIEVLWSDVRLNELYAILSNYRRTRINVSSSSGQLQ